MSEYRICRCAILSFTKEESAHYELCNDMIGKLIEFSLTPDRAFAVKQRARISFHGDVVHSLHEQQPSSFASGDSTWPPDALAAAGGQSASASTNGFTGHSPAEELHYRSG